MRVGRGSWYEIWIKKSHGAKLDGTFTSVAKAKKKIKETVEKQKSLGYKPDEFFIMICDAIYLVDENGDTISETTTYARV